MSEHYIGGQVMISYIDFVKKKSGPQGLMDMEKHMGIPLNEIVVEKDYSYKYSDLCLTFINEKYGTKDVIQAGRFSATNIGTKRYFAVILPPKKLLDMLVESVSKVTNSVVVSYELNEKGAEVLVKGPYMHSLEREYWLGMLMGLFDLNKRDGKVEPLDFKDGEEARYSMKW